MTNPVPRTSIVLIVLLAAAALTACGGGDSAAEFKPGPLVCDTLSSESYRYQVQATTEVVAGTGTPVPSTAPFQGPATLYETIEGGVSDGNKYEVTIDNSDGLNTTTIQAIQLDNNVGYLKFGYGWQLEDTSQQHLQGVSYLPSDLCNAIAPDIDTSKLGTPQADKVNGIDSQSFTLTDFPSQYFARDPDFGRASDPGTYIKNLNGTIWVANSGYLAKMDITGVGQYPNGQSFKIRLTFQVSDVGKSVDVKAPS